ncbi:nucleolar protein dao-5-like isoform X2 [Cydia pomonella]|uniref:nucleolar protein dao-5-like isoform X2 n=1 Tax=Cydia pomonella TaxID=82600 RepID=UPI002ADE61B4|nr:nucleolar protein dao-5-like isoform X2 [Cydia pomonella]
MNNKHVETLDDGQLRALLDEAITYKCPKDREGKSSLFKELLEEVEQDEQDEQACEAAARLGGGRARRGGGRGRRALPHSNSLQDLVAALAAEPAPRRARHSHHPPAPVSARAIHGGSLPSGVDTSFLLSEEPMRGVVASTVGGAEYVATVRCVNPSPLAERRVSASDAHCPDTDALNRRSKPVFPMYTARATLEIGSGSVCSGRAVTTTTASNQVRTPPPHTPGNTPRPRGPEPARRVTPLMARDPRGRSCRPLDPAGDRNRSYWHDNACVDKWYRGLEVYNAPLDRLSGAMLNSKDFYKNEQIDDYYKNSPHQSPVKLPKNSMDTSRLTLVSKDKYIPIASENPYETKNHSDIYNIPKMLDVKDVEEAMARQAYRERVGKDLVAPCLVSCNPKNIRSMSIGPSLHDNMDKKYQNPSTSDTRDKNKDKSNRNTRNRNERNANVNVATDKPAPAKPDSSKLDRRSKMSHSGICSAGKTRSPSPLTLKPEVSRNSSKQNNVEDKTNKDNTQEKPRKEKTHLEKDTDLAIMKENSQNHIELTKIKKAEQKEKSIIKMSEEKENPIIEKTEEKENPKIEKAEEKQCPITEDHKDVEMVTRQTTQKTFFDFVKMVAAEENQRNANEDNISFIEMIMSKDEPRTLAENTKPQIKDISLVEMVSMQSSPETESSNEFSLFMANQQRLLRAIESNNYHKNEHNNETSTPETEISNNIKRPERRDIPNVESPIVNPCLLTVERALNPVSEMDCFDDKDSETSGTEMVDMRRARTADYAQDLPVNASYFLTLYKRLLTSPSNIDNTLDIKPSEVKPPLVALDSAAKLPKKKKDKITARLARKPHNENSNKKKDIIRNALKKLFFDNITQSDSTKLPSKATTKEVDSAIPFSCITSPEVVASCTTTASAQAAVAVDPKPARSMAASTFNGVPLPRAGPHFSTAAAELEFKQKSLDENGNSVQGFSSPQSGSSQQKKQRRKKSSKNETVIKSHHIDGYQGNKDLNEVLRFIESNEPERPKRHDDKKKRSAERRKDKQPRASSLDDLSRAAPPPARPARPAQPAPKPERRSWGDERQPFYFRDSNPEPDPELTDFQTVTKKRKPRRRADEPSPRPPRRAPSPRSPPSPRARSDRSNDSNDDLDSVHSLPSLPCRPAPPASYADIARTKHNIPDLIESCNYYGEGAPEQPALPEPAPAPGDADGYPALDPRPRRGKPAGGRRGGEEPAPDVVASRPPVILLDSAARPRDMDGVTFGFDIDERLLGAPLPLPVPVRAGRAALRYVQPAPPAELAHLHQIVDYVGTAWEDVVRCSSGKVRYFSE